MSGLATTALTFGLIGLAVSICTLGIPSLMAIAFGLAALRETQPGAKRGRHRAMAGIILGLVVVIPLGVVVLLEGLHVP
jgi:hypothetical protein